MKDRLESTGKRIFIRQNEGLRVQQSDLGGRILLNWVRNLQGNCWLVYEIPFILTDLYGVFNYALLLRNGLDRRFIQEMTLFEEKLNY